MIIVLQSFVIVNLFDFYFAMRVHFIEYGSISIQRRLKPQIVSSNDGTLRLMQRASIELWHLSELLNERFAFSLLVTATSKLTIFVVDIYWVYTRLVHSLFDFYFIRNLLLKVFTQTLKRIFPFSCLHSLSTSFYIVDWNFLLLQRGFKWIQNHLTTLAQIIQSRFVKAAGKLFLTINHNKDEVYSERFLWNVKHNATWRKNSKIVNWVFKVSSWFFFRCFQRYQLISSSSFSSCQNGTSRRWNTRWTRRIRRRFVESSVSLDNLIRCEFLDTHYV